MTDTPFSGDQLLAMYDRVAGAEDAIPRLRRFVLDLAVRGKLVEQDAGDVASSYGYSSDVRSAPYTLPLNWRWMKIGDQLTLLNGMAFKPTDWVNKGLKIVRIQNLNKPDAPFNFCAPEMARDRSLIDNDSFLISWSGTPGTSFGAFIWDRGPAVLNQHIFRCDFKTNAFNSHFLRLAINGRLDEMISRAHGGVGLQHITKGKLESMLIALPPLAEQHRIVAKVQELMALLDGLEAARGRAEGARDKLTAATLHRLTDPDTDSQTATAFALQTLPALTTRPDQIKPLRQTILNLAVRGRLVPQDPADEPASVLLEQIAAEKARLVKEGSARKPRELLGLNEKDIPCDLPSNWAWTNISELGFVGPRVEASDDTVASFVPMPMVFAEYGTPNRHEKRQWREIKKGYTHFAEGDVGLAKITPCFENGKSTVFRGLTGGIGAGTTELHVLRPVLVNPDYILIFLKSPHFVQTGIPKMTGTAGQKRVPTEYFTSTPFPLPPLAEQHRIVAKVDALMALCDQLETALTTTATTRSRLLDTLIRSALSPDAELLEVAE